MKREKINVVLYLRVSTEEQAERGHSLKQQEEALVSYCNKMGYCILKIYSEDHSAKNFNRPEWTLLKAFVKANKKDIDKVLFTKWDRFSRNIEQAYVVLSELRRSGVELNAVEQHLDMTVSNYKMMLAVFLVQGEMERDNISDRTLKGTNQAKRDGYFCGKAPYGYTNFRDEFKKSTLVQNEFAHFVIKAYEEVAMAVEPMEAIRIRLSKDGLNLQKSSFSEMLKNIVYAGKIVVPEFNKQPEIIVDGKHEALVSMSTFQKVQVVLKGRRWHGLKPSHTNLAFPLRDFLSCEYCGRQITGSISKGRRKKYGYYHCRNKCKTRVSIEQTHKMVGELLSNLQISSNIKELFADVLRDTESTINGNKQAQLNAKIERHQHLKMSIEQAENMLLKSEIGPDRFNNIVTRLNNELMNINMEIEVLGANEGSLTEYIDSGLELLESLEMLFSESDYDGKRILAGSLFNQRLIFGNGGCRTREVNEVLALLTRTGKGFEGNKKGKATKIGSFSGLVPRTGVEPLI
jgi:site-specific DNA recombinase